MTEQIPGLPAIVSTDEWRAARVALLQEEKALTRAGDAVRAKRRALPMVRVEKDYRFTGPEGEVGLRDLFDGRPQLIVHHLMWLDATDEGCPGCSMLVDTLGDLAHLHAANTSFVFISRAPFERLEAYRRRMGWSTPLYSSAGSSFNYDFQATVDPAHGAREYNYRDAAAPGGPGASFTGDLPAESVFLRVGDEVFHTYSAYARGTETGQNVWAFLDFTPLGRQDDARWLRHRDRYEPSRA